MAASRSTRVTRSTVGINGLDENFCGRTLRNRSIAHAEEVVPPSLLRSRSPKKRPEPAQKAIYTKSGDLKHSGTRESWISPRKRGLSVSEKDITEKDSVEKQSPLSPVLKKIKRYLRSEEPNSPEELSTTERRNSCSDNETDTTHTKRAHRCILLDDSDKREIKKESAPEEHIKTLNVETASYKTINGVDEKNAADLTCNDCQTSGNIKQNTVVLPLSKEQIASENGSCNLLNPCSVLTNNRKDTHLDHNVPCTNSEELVGKKEHNLAADCLPANQLSSCAEPLSTARNSEETVKVEDSASKSNNGSITCDVNAILHKSVSGEPESDLSFTELDIQEHRYTLRTSPRRPLSSKDSLCKVDFPFEDNGPVEEYKICSNETSKSTGTVMGSLINKDNNSFREKINDEISVKCLPVTKTISSLESVPITQHLPSYKEKGTQQTMDEDEEDPDVFYFESDHLALKHNTDYQRLLQTISVLEAQRTQAVQDIERLGQHQKQAQADPIGFVENLQKKVDIGMPCPQRIVQLPDISWDQYTTGLGNFERELRKQMHHSRRVKLRFDKGI
ncbi:hypothetical protein GDO86_008040 [Hymenochirus boettgeri]|uniref:Uncharacterized protein n=1 Tax=Hymenochirus boettgeri TaxID=247094 RepID=A0A8T2J1B2_9PIPI|nr:hypothetical protein GDO86_008040 [Hymenochirus boettgeri]